MKGRHGRARQSRSATKLGLTMLVLAVLGTVVGIGTWSAFSGTTENTGNTFTSGTVSITDNDSGTPPVLYAVTGAKPGQNTVKCIKLTYGGSLDAYVHIFSPTGTAPAGSEYVNVTIEKGTSDTSTFPNCGTFTVEGSALYTGTLQNFIQTKTSYETGIDASPGSQTSWQQNNTLVYRFTVSVADNNAAQGITVTSHAYKWEARST